MTGPDGLLSETERLLLGRLSVFAGGWGLGAAERVCAGAGIEAGGVLDLLMSLVDKSLVVFQMSATEEPEATGRYRMQETVRQYASERLEAAGEAETTRASHRDYFLSLAEAAEPHLKGTQQSAWLARLDMEHDNLRAALAWCETEDVDHGDSGLRLCSSLGWFWYVRGHCSEGRCLLAHALDRAKGLSPSQWRARALYEAGSLAWRQSDYGAAQILLEESLEGGHRLGDQSGIANTLNSLGNVALHQGNYEAAQALYEESLGIARRVGDQRAIAIALGNLASVAAYQGDYEAARVLYEESLGIARRVGDQRAMRSHSATFPRLQYSQATTRRLGLRLKRCWKCIGRLAIRAGLPTRSTTSVRLRWIKATAKRLELRLRRA